MPVEATYAFWILSLPAVFAAMCNTFASMTGLGECDAAGDSEARTGFRLAIACGVATPAVVVGAFGVAVWFALGEL
ncbi:MAG TPA: hypothetical protein VM533_02710 [Fimbriiglobus sp.]|nr:hypothetical protein [Fimbriiglobus sp.]